MKQKKKAEKFNKRNIKLLQKINAIWKNQMGFYRMEKSSNINKKLTGRVQQQNGRNRGKNQSTGRQNNKNYLI